MFWAICGLAAFGIIGSGAAWVVRAKAATELSVTPLTPKATPPPSPPVDLLVQSVAPSAKLQFRGGNLTLPYHGEVAPSKTPELLEISAPGFQGRRFWVKLDRARSFTVALPQGSGVDDATYEETLTAMGAHSVEPEAPAPDVPAPAPSPEKHSRRDPSGEPDNKVTAPKDHAPAPAPAAPAAAPSAEDNPY